LFFVVCAAVVFLLLKCSHHYHHHHHQHLHNLKDGYNSMLKYLNSVLIILTLYVNFSWTEKTPLKCHLKVKKCSSKTLNFNNMKSSGKKGTKHNRIAIYNTTCCWLEELILAKIYTEMRIQE
jgi:hypothetical protein